MILLSDWTDLDPATLYRRMKKMPMHDNTYQRTVGDFMRDARKDGLRETLSDRGMWGRMRMTPSDLSDINAHTYTYLMNGTAPAGNWTGLFRSGEKVLLRFINGSAMTYFDVRIPGLKMTVVVFAFARRTTSNWMPSRRSASAERRSLPASAPALTGHSRWRVARSSETSASA